MKPLMFKIRGGCEEYMKPDGTKGTAGKGALVSEDKAFTVAAAQDQFLAQPIPINTQLGLRGNTSNSPREGVGIGKEGDPAFTLQAQHHHAVAQPIGFHNRQDPDVSGDITHPLGAQDNGMGVATSDPDVAQVQWASGGGKIENDTAQALRAGAEHNYQFLRQARAVRRLTPRECERLQGFPDDYTQIPWRNKPADQCPDGPRYKALGNSWAVPVVRWIGERIKEQAK